VVLGWGYGSRAQVVVHDVWALPLRRPALGV